MATINPEGPEGYLQFRDALFRKKHKRAGWRVVEAPTPALEGPVADTHAHLGLMSDPALSLARCAIQGVDFICTIADAVDDGAVTYQRLDEWRSAACRILPDVAEATRRAICAYREQAANKGGASTPELMVDEERLNRYSREKISIPHVRIAVGVHPHGASAWDAEVERLLRGLLADPRTAALGEVGLDYHYDYSPRDVQRDVFRRQIVLAHECGLPLVLHMREAHDDGFAILEEEGWPAAGVLLHCCSVGPDELSRWIDRGCFVAFGGALTFGRSDNLRASATIVPQGRLLTETDSPYMAPVPFRGIECGPELTLYTAQRIAEVRGAKPGSDRAALLADMHAAALSLLDRQSSAWQCSHAQEATKVLGERHFVPFEVSGTQNMGSDNGENSA